MYFIRWCFNMKLWDISILTNDIKWDREGVEFYYQSNHGLHIDQWWTTVLLF